VATFEILTGLRITIGGNMKRFIFTLMTLLILIANLQGQWEILNEGITGSLNTIDFVNDRIGWMAGGDECNPLGQKASLFKTEDAGESWHPLVVEGDFSIAMIDFINDSVGWAIGNEDLLATQNGNILKTTDGGYTWSLQKKTPEDITLLSLQAINDSIAYIIGTQNRGSIDLANVSGVILKTSDGGTNWIDISPRNAKERTYETCQFFNNQIGLVSGYLDEADWTRKSIILKTNDGGMTWEETIVPEFEWRGNLQFIDDSTGFFSARKPGQDSCSLYKTTDRLMSWSLVDQSHNFTTFFYLDRDLAFAIGSNSIMKSADGGKTWEEKLPIGNLNVNKLYFCQNVGFSFGGSNFFYNCAGIILRSADRGEHWMINKLTYDFQDVCFIDRDKGFAAGGWLYQHLAGYGDMFITQDGGKTWNLNFSTNQKIESCCFVNQTTGFILSRVRQGVGSHIYKTFLGGARWEEVFSGNGADFGFEGLDICFVNETNGWAVGQGRGFQKSGAAIITTRNGGIQWKMDWVKQSDVGQGDFLHKIYFLNENQGWAVGDSGLIVKYTPQDQWQEQTAITDLPLNEVFFIDENNGFVAGGYLCAGFCSCLLKTTDGGESWIEVPNVHYFINDIYFLNQRYGWAVGYGKNFSGVILATDDGGNHWTVQVDSLIGGLKSLNCRDNYLWAVGDYGLVLRTTVDSTTGIDERPSSACPMTFELAQNYPNPFNPKTAISYQLSAASQVELSIFNLLGQRVTILVSAKQAAGSYKVEWDGAEFSSGVYFCRLEAGEFIKVIKLALVK
jgi:photosystem II stability/assembly factor-like uncharacterized protein